MNDPTGIQRKRYSGRSPEVPARYDEFEMFGAADTGEAWDTEVRRRSFGLRRPRPRRPAAGRRFGQRRPIGRPAARARRRPLGSRLSPARGANQARRRPRPGRRPFRRPRRRVVVRDRQTIELPLEQGAEYVRWVQSTLNQVLNLRLPVTGVMDPATRSAIRDFQQQQGLPEDGIVGPDTERALQQARTGQSDAAADGGNGGAKPNGNGQAKGPEAPPGEEPSGQEEEFFGNLFDTAKDFLSGTRIIDLTAEADKSKRKRHRESKTVYALVLHQMACCFERRDPLKSYLRTNSHFVILQDGKILQLHPISAYLFASHGLNKGSVAVEFAGNFPNTRGKWWKGDKYGRNHVTKAQIEAGRYLVRHLIRTMGLTHILAHRQSSAMRENDPGPDIWYHVGQWAINNHGLKDGGPGFKVGDGNPIPEVWRTWGSAKPTPELEEEIDPESSMHERWLQKALNRTLGLHLRADDAGGPAVRSALRTFQRRHGLPVDGQLSEEVEELLVAAGAPPHRHPSSP